MIYKRRAQKYTFTEDGEKFIFHSASLPREANLATVMRAKRLVNASKKFVSLCIRLHDEPSKRSCMLERKMTTMRRGMKESFPVVRRYQVPRKARWYRKDGGAREFPQLKF